MDALIQHVDNNAIVNEIVRRYPATIAVFNQFGVDTCCGGGVALWAAAERHGVDVKQLVDQLNRIIGQ